MRKRTKHKNLIISFFFLVCLYVLDRVLKGFFLQNTFSFNRSPFFDFSFHPNPFLAFSIPFLPQIVTICVMLVCIILFSVLGARWMYRGFFFSGYAAFFIALGALSNLYDRFTYGYVIDYLSLFPSLGLPYFNIADGMIIFGILFILIKRQKI